MSIEHDNLPANPRLESLLREIVAAGDLQPAQNQRVRTRLGLDPQPIASMATPSLTLPDTRAATNLVPTAVQEESPTIATSRHRLRQQWFQFALAGAAFIAVGVLLALVFGSGNDEPAAQPGTTGTPEATATTATANPELAVRDALEPLPSGQERRLVLEVEAHNQHDNAFDRWTIELWQHWSAADVLSEGLYVSDPAGEVVTHIALNGQQPLLNWEPRDGLFDVPLEYSLQRRVLGATLAAVNDPDAHALRSEERDGLVV
ncbi:MAG: hypothetical protein M3439_12715, partial [Chloroflexota bacterium]|nr:hypothetical protein [Chloroflexota bacterium]